MRLLQSTADVGTENWRAGGQTSKREVAINDTTLGYMAIRNLRYKVEEIEGYYPFDYKVINVEIFEPDPVLADKYKDYFMIN